MALVLAVPSSASSDTHELGETATYTITPDHARPGAQVWVEGRCDPRRETAAVGVRRSEDDPNYNWQTDPDFYWWVDYTTSAVDGSFEGPMDVPAGAPPGLYDSNLLCMNHDAVGGMSGILPFVVEGEAGSPTSSTAPPTSSTAPPTSSTAPPVTTRPQPPSSGPTTPAGPTGGSEPPPVTVAATPATSPADDARATDELAGSRKQPPRTPDDGGPPLWINLVAAMAVIATALGAHRAWRHRSI